MSAERSPDSGETIAERNLARLLTMAYQPDAPSEEFARRLTAAARQRAAQRMEETNMESTASEHISTRAGFGRAIGWAAAAAVVVAVFAFVLLHGRNEPKSEYRAQENIPHSGPVLAETGTRPALTGTTQTPAVIPLPPAPAMNLVALKEDLPKRLFEGTPKALTVLNLAKPRDTSVPFMVPAGCRNVALNKPVKSSDPEPTVGELKQVTDGDKEAVEGSYIELGPGLQWVQIDLQGQYNIYAIVLWHFHKEARIYHAVVVQVADDPDFITNVRTVFNNDASNSAGLGVGTDLEYLDEYTGKLIDTKGVKARYVRCYSKGNTSNDQNHYTEVEVWGLPAK